MFESLSDRLGKIFEGLTGRGALSEAEVDAALREVRRALLEANVSLEVGKAFVEQVRERAVGGEVTRSVTPGQQVIMIVHDELVKVLGETPVPLDFNAPAPVGILMVGLQGAGKTTHAGKIAKRLKERQNKKVLMASLDDRRPAAKEQLRVLGTQIGVDTLPIQLNDPRVDITGIVLTRVDGDGRGGAALSMRAATGKPIKLIGTGEKLDALEDFRPASVADRILGMGDIVSLVEKAAQTVNAEDAAKMAKKLKKGNFDLEDLRSQLLQMKTMGGMGALMGLMPGMGQVKKAMAGANLDEKVFDRQIAIINSLTKGERAAPDVLTAKRCIRIANGSGTKVEDVNKLMKQHRQMADMMKKVQKGGIGSLAGMFGGPAGKMMPGQ